MRTMPQDGIVCRVDTHADTHMAAVLDPTGRVLAVDEFTATSSGYRELMVWLTRFGSPVAAGVEGTSSYGKGLTSYLRDQGVSVVEVIRPNRQVRRLKGKSDPADAIAAARAVLSGEATAVPKTGDGPVEAIRALRITRSSAVKHELRRPTRSEI